MNSCWMCLTECLRSTDCEKLFPGDEHVGDDDDNDDDEGEI